MVVKPLKARIPSAVAPRKPVSEAPGSVAEKFTSTASAISTPTTPNRTMPPILIKPRVDATPSIRALPDKLIRKATSSSPTPRMGTSRLLSSISNNCKV